MSDNFKNNERLENSTHLWLGHQSCITAFVLSTPGKKEQLATKPASGDTGENILCALNYLNKWLTEYFPSIDIDYYRITNSTIHVMYAAKDNGRTEANALKVLDVENIDRIKNEVKDKHVVILCGKNAQLITSHLPNKIVIDVCHPGNKGINNTYANKHGEIKVLPDSHSRRLKRLELWAIEIIKRIRSNF